MVHLSADFANSALDPEERTVEAPDGIPTRVAEAGPSLLPPAREDGVSSPVCAACWAY